MVWLARVSQGYEDLAGFVISQCVVCVMLASVPHCDLVLVHFILKPRESFTHCTDFSNHTRDLLLSGKPDQLQLCSASCVCQVPNEACHLSTYSRGSKAELGACRMKLRWHQHAWVSPTQLPAGKCLPLCLETYGLPHCFREMPSSQSGGLLKLHVTQKSTETYTAEALCSKLTVPL